MTMDHRPAHRAGHDGFECPERLEPGTINLIAQGEFPCPEQIPTPRFSSPTSDLPEAELRELELCIEAVNQLLRAVGNPRDRQNREELRRHFRQLLGITVRVTVECRGAEPEPGQPEPPAEPPKGEDVVIVLGGLKDVGRNFIQVDTVGPQTYIPFDRICLVERTDTGPVLPVQQPALLDIDPQLRRNVILRFGETVSCSPELINIFFGLPLHLRLVSFIGCPAVVQAAGRLVEGTLCAAEERFVQIQVAENRVRQINLADICFVRV
ncbi:MAG: hypothetical protein ACOY94_27560 [Bacillota bacterium]